MINHSIFLLKYYTIYLYQNENKITKIQKQHQLWYHLINIYINTLQNIKQNRYILKYSPVSISQTQRVLSRNKFTLIAISISRHLSGSPFTSTRFILRRNESEMTCWEYRARPVVLHRLCVGSTGFIDLKVFHHCGNGEKKINKRRKEGKKGRKRKKESVTITVTNVSFFWEGGGEGLAKNSSP